MKNENLSSSIGHGLGVTVGIGSSWFVGMCTQAVFQDQSGSGFVDMGEETSAGADSMTEMADGNIPALTTVLGLLSSFSGSSSSEPDAVIEVFTRNKKAHSAVERKAKQIYDKYNDGHIKEKNEGVSLLTDSPEVAKTLNEIIDNASSKHQLLCELYALEELIKQQDNKEQKGHQYIIQRKNNDKE